MALDPVLKALLIKELKAESKKKTKYKISEIVWGAIWFVIGFIGICFWGTYGR